MKIIEGLKQQKLLQKRIEDLMEKIRAHASYSSLERPVYRNEAGNPDDSSAQIEQVKAWIQSCADTVKLMATLRLRIQITNLAVKVSIDIGGQTLTKSIAEWVHWRREFSDTMGKVYSCLGDKGLREGVTVNSQGEKQEVRIIRCYNPTEKDRLTSLYRDMKYLVDSTLEIVNATTDMVDTPELHIVKEEVKDNKPNE